MLCPEEEVEETKQILGQNTVMKEGTQMALEGQAGDFAHTWKKKQEKVAHSIKFASEILFWPAITLQKNANTSRF